MQIDKCINYLKKYAISRLLNRYFKVKEIPFLHEKVDSPVESKEKSSFNSCNTFKKVQKFSFRCLNFWRWRVLIFRFAE